MSVQDSPHDSQEIDLSELVHILWKRRWVIAATIVLFTGVFGVAAWMMTPVYRATTVLLPASTDSSSLRGLLDSATGISGLASLAGLSLDKNTRQVEEALAVLTSRSFIQAFITERNLMPVLFADSWEDEREKPTLSQAHRLFTRNVLSVVRETKSGLILIRVEWRDRELAANWANDLVRRLNAEMRERDLQTAETSIKFLEAELKRTNFVGTQGAIGRLIEAQINQRMLATVTEEYAFQVVDPALPPDQGDPIRPNKVVLLLLGAVVGGILSAGIVIMVRVTAFVRT